MPDRVHTWVQPMQPPATHPRFDPVQAKPHPFQLPPSHNPILPPGQLSNPGVPHPSLLRTAYLTAGSRLGGHGAMVSPLALRVARGV
jgi:hypothetical protein